VRASEPLRELLRLVLCDGSVGTRALAREAGVPPARVSEILHERPRPISLEVQRRLLAASERVLAGSPATRQRPGPKTPPQLDERSVILHAVHAGVSAPQAAREVLSQAWEAGHRDTGDADRDAVKTLLRRVARHQEAGSLAPIGIAAALPPRHAWTLTAPPPRRLILSRRIRERQAEELARAVPRYVRPQLPIEQCRRRSRPTT
jgi:hypothetical protein